MTFTKALYLFLIFLLFSCNLLSFSDEKVYCSIKENETDFEGNYVSFVFSESCNPIDAEESITMSEENVQVKMHFCWINNILNIQPENGWKKGCLYHLEFNGNLRLGSQNVSASIIRHFYYGRIDLMPNVVESSISYPGHENGELKLVFNKAMDVKLLKEKIRFYPSLDFIESFSDDGRTISISPKDKWEKNTLYKIQLEDLVSLDGYHLKVQELSFEIPFDSDLPELLKVERLVNVDGEYIAIEDGNSLSEINGKDGIRLTFSKPMKEESIDEGVTISPYVEGTIKQMDGEGCIFAFIPETKYKGNQQYEIKIDRNVSDLDGLKLKEVEKFYFKPENHYLKISNVRINSTDISLSDRLEKYFTVGLSEENFIQKNELETESFCTIILNFSSIFDFTDYKNIVDKIKLKIKFPLTASSPYLKSVTWLTPSIVSLEYGNLVPSTKENPVYYQLTIAGGENGIKNSLMEPLEEDVCIYIELMSE